MKSETCSKWIVGLVLTMLCAPLVPALRAQGPTPAPAPVREGAPMQLSADVWDVLRLARGNVSEATVIAYVKNSGKAYPLSASEILYLREKGLSDAVVTAMLNQPKNQVAPPPSTPTAQPSVWANSNQPQYVSEAPAPTYVQPAPVYTPAPAPAPVYVYPAPSYGYYSAWPYSSAYWGFPALSFSFGWGGRYGGYHGGGFHGGGHFGGGHR